MVQSSSRGRDGGRVGGTGEERHEVVVRDGLHLQGVLLGVVCREDLVEDDDSAVSISGGEHECLAVRRPGIGTSVHAQ